MLLISSFFFFFKAGAVGFLHSNSSVANRPTQTHVNIRALFVCAFLSPRICWITPALQEVAQDSLSLFREPSHDKSHLMSVWVSVLFKAIFILTIAQPEEPPHPLLFTSTRRSYCDDTETPSKELHQSPTKNVGLAPHTQPRREI